MNLNEYKKYYDNYYHINEWNKLRDAEESQKQARLMDVLRNSHSNIGCIKPEESNQTENLLLLLEDVC